MSDFERLIWIVIGLVGILSTRYSAYRMGATDGYRFARDPSHPGARKAGRYVYKTMSVFYGDIPNQDNLSR